MVRVECIYVDGYDDKVLGRKVKYGEKFNVDEERAELLKKYKLVKEIVEVKEKPKRRSKV